MKEVKQGGLPEFRMLLKNIDIVLPDKILKSGSLFIEDNIITDISQQSNLNYSGEIIDGKNNLIALPGFIDLHIHGAQGISVTDKDPNSLFNLSNILVKFGITGFLWTTMAAPVEDINFVMEQANKFDNYYGSQCHGINIEGSFISKNSLGSHSLEYLLDDDINLIKKWQEISNNKIKIVTVAPERVSSEFIAFLLEQNIVVSVGHSKADYEQTLNALEHGASHFTHLGNATGMPHQRKPGLVSAALLDENASIEIICDGHHLHSAIVKIFLKVKGFDKVTLVSDGTCVMGMPSGEYDWYDNKAYFDGETLKLKDDTIAGGVQPLNYALKNVMKFTDCSLIEAVNMISLLPAKKLNISENYGSLEKNKFADIVLVDKNYDIVSTFIKGKKVYG
jgi:N-acetylglucosamine-6-phosphate deacetylase